MKLSQFSSNDQEIRQMTSYLSRADDLCKQLSDQFGATIQVKDAEVKLSVNINKLKATILFLETELKNLAQTMKLFEEEVEDLELVAFLQNYEMMLQFKQKIRASVEIVQKRQQAQVQFQETFFQTASAVFDFKGWWAYEVDRNDKNYNTRDFNHLNCIFYDSDQNWQIEHHYQMCLQMSRFGTAQKVTGDQQGNKNGFVYDVYGTSRDAAYDNSTWVQKNMTHENHRIRRIFRFGQTTQEFRTILRKQPEAKKLLEEESKTASIEKVTKVKSFLVFKGTKVQISEAKKELTKLFANEDNHMCKYEIDKHIPSTVFNEIA